MPTKKNDGKRKRRNGGSPPLAKKSRGMYANLPLTRTALGKVLHAINDVELPPPLGTHEDHWCGWCSQEFDGRCPKQSRQIHFFRHQGPWRCDIPGCSVPGDHDFLGPYNLAKHKKLPHGSSRPKQVLQQDAADGSPEAGCDSIQPTKTNKRTTRTDIGGQQVLISLRHDAEDDATTWTDVSQRSEVTLSSIDQLEPSQYAEVEHMPS